MIVPAPQPLSGFDRLIKVSESAAPLNYFLGSPAVTYHKGKLLFLSDTFGVGAPAGRSNLYQSDLAAEVWTNMEVPLDGIYWGRFLDFDPDTLYAFGTGAENQHTVIAKTTDGGASWTKTSLDVGAFATAPTNYEIVDDIIYCPIEGVVAGRPASVLVWKAPISGDLMSAATWTKGTLCTFASCSAMMGGIEFLEFNIVYHEGVFHLYGRILYGNNFMAHLTYNPTTGIITPVGKIACPWGWCKFHMIRCKFTGAILVFGNERHPEHSGGIDEDRTNLRCWATKDNFATWKEVFDFGDLGEPNWREQAEQYPYAYQPGPGVSNNLYLGIRSGDHGNSGHNSNEMKIGVYQNFANTINL